MHTSNPKPINHANKTQAVDNNAMHAKSGLRVVLEWKIYRPDSVIAAVILPESFGMECLQLG
jgi:hypothetical protein